MDRLSSENSHWKTVDMIVDGIKSDNFKQMSKEQQLKQLKFIINSILLDKIKNKSDKVKASIKEEIEDALKEAFPNDYQEYVDIISF